MARTRFRLSVNTLLVLLALLFSLSAAENNIFTDQSSLVALKSHITYDPKNILKDNWSNSTFVCNWTGVTCGVHDDHLRVEALNLSFMGLVGIVPPHLGNLSFLVNLDFQNNSFRDILPSELSYLRELELINFKFNNLIGEIPSWLGVLPKLAFLFLDSNGFSGSLPTSLCNLTSMEAIGLSYNKLSGSIPKDIGNLTMLKELYLAHNKIEEIPKEISIIQMEILEVSNNSFKGPVPPFLFNISSLKVMNLSENEFSSTLPDNLCQSLPVIQEMYFLNNKLSGPIPTKLWQCKELRVLSLEGNTFSGVIPRCIGTLTKLRKLHLDSNKLTEIPKEISNLQLEELKVFDNSFKGQVPLFLFNMSSLKVMRLSQNKFSGTLPDNLCQSLPVIQDIRLYHNQLSGQIPTKLWKCNELRVLSLGANNFSGVIPQNIGNLTKLRMLDLSHNMLTGTIPKVIGNLQNLEILYLQVNSISGVVPPTLFNISTIRKISLAVNNFSGSLPSTLGLSVPNLEEIFMLSNSLSGEIPKYISNASQLVRIDIPKNHFSGYIPNSLNALKNLQWLNLGENNLTLESTTSKVSILSTATFRDLRFLSLHYNPLNVMLPTSIGNLSTSLEKLYLNNCNLRGSIPSTIANLSRLISLSLVNNGLSGSIPTSIGRLQNLQGLYLNDNKLQGLVPIELCQLQRLGALDLSQNMLLGAIPTCLGNLSTSLRRLSLASNQLDSVIPSTFWSLTDILGIDLSFNSLNGSLPLDIRKLKVVMYVDVSNNQLSGNISSSIGDLQALQYLFLNNNRFEGTIPDSFGNLISIVSLDLSENNLSGEIPKSLKNLLYLQFLNLSFNKLYGEIPSGGSFANFSFQSFMGNYDLCGASRLHVSPCKNASRKAHVLIWRYMIPCLSIMVIIVILIILVLCRKGKKKHDSEIALFPNQKLWRNVTQLELSRATDRFKDDNLLGSGNFGKVYKGILSNGENVAIKVFNSEMEEGFKSFKTECEMLCNIRHRNLLKVITSCSNIDFKALVLEYIPRGSLEKLLYYSDEFYMNILQRLNVMIDVALALEYLHHGYSTTIVHCDLKPSNVLLDEDMVAHVADFGIAKLLCEEDFITQTMTLATVGYMAPEYGLNGIVSRKGDVYSYGIMLMEVFTRKKPTDEMFSEEMNLKQWVQNSFPHAVPNIIDANLLRTEDQHYTIKKDCLSQLMELALACSSTSPEERIDMKNILTTLNKIKMKLLMNVREN